MLLASSCERTHYWVFWSRQLEYSCEANKDPSFPRWHNISKLLFPGLLLSNRVSDIYLPGRRRINQSPCLRSVCLHEMYDSPRMPDCAGNRSIFRLPCKHFYGLLFCCLLYIRSSPEDAKQSFTFSLKEVAPKFQAKFSTLYQN